MSRAPAKIYSAAVQALSTQTRWSLPAASQRRQHSCSQQRRRPPSAAWTVTICNVMRVLIPFCFPFKVSLKCLKVRGTERRLDCTWTSWWTHQLFSLCCAARKEAFPPWRQLPFRHAKLVPASWQNLLV